MIRFIAANLSVGLLLCSCAFEPEEINWRKLEADAGLERGQLNASFTTDVRSGDCNAVQSWIDFAEARGKLSRAAGRGVSWSPFIRYVDDTLRGIGCFDSNGNLRQFPLNDVSDWAAD